MDKFVRPILSLALLPVLASGQTAAQECPDAKKVKALCMYIDSRTPAEVSDSVRYKYQRQVLNAACVTPEDSEAVKEQKIQSMWKQFEDRLVCNNLQFDVSNGNIIKFAASSLFDPFIYDVIKWKVELNRVDATDGRTVLDYLKYRIDQQQNGGPVKEQFEIYYRALREAGAKHKSELPD